MRVDAVRPSVVNVALLPTTPSPTSLSIFAMVRARLQDSSNYNETDYCPLSCSRSPTELSHLACLAALLRTATLEVCGE